MLSYSWDTGWESQPTTGLSRNSLDDHLRRTTLGVRERMEREHDWGPYSSGDSGKHLPGQVSAILTGNAAARAAVSNPQEGSVFFQDDGTNLTIWLYTSSAWVEITDDDHDNLENLTDDAAHTQYMLKDGNYTEATATLDMNGNVLSASAATGAPLQGEHPHDYDPHAGILSYTALADNTLDFSRIIHGSYLHGYSGTMSKGGSFYYGFFSFGSSVKALLWFNMQAAPLDAGDWEYGCFPDGAIGWGAPANVGDHVCIRENSILSKTCDYNIGWIT